MNLLRANLITASPVQHTAAWTLTPANGLVNNETSIEGVGLHFNRPTPAIGRNDPFL